MKSLSYLKRITPAKLANLSGIYFSYKYARLSGKASIWGLPFSMAIEPTTSCNLRCPECPSGLRSFTRPTGVMDEGLFKKIIDEVKSHVAFLTLYFQGEPFLHPKIFSLINYAEQNGIFTTISTNGHYMDEHHAKETIKSGLSKLIVSIDGIDQASYSNYRIGGTLEKVLDGVRNLVKVKKEMASHSPAIYFQFLVVRQNEHQVDAIKQLAKEYGSDRVNIKTAQVYDYKNGNPLIPLNPKYSRYRQTKNGSYELKNKLTNNCWRLWHSSVITWDGKVVPCCFDKDASHVMGNISHQPFKEIWHNEKYVRFRKSLIVSRKQIDICTNCSEGTKVFA